MMSSTLLDVSASEPLSHAEAMGLQAAELDQTVALLRALDEADWAAQTDCPAWDVRMMYLHVLGACDAAASMRENAHQMLTAKRRQRKTGGPLEAALSATQVRERLDLAPTELVERLAAVAPGPVRHRTTLPAHRRGGE
jgi:uncharacterized protein (TIGR03083 family)